MPRLTPPSPLPSLPPAATLPPPPCLVLPRDLGSGAGALSNDQPRVFLISSPLLSTLEWTSTPFVRTLVSCWLSTHTLPRLDL